MRTNNLRPPDGETKSAPAFLASTTCRVFLALALFFCVLLLLSSVRGVSQQTHVYLGSVPLALAGAGYALLQIALRPAPGILLKRLLLAATFVGWAVDQMLPAGPVAVVVGDAVIAAYVLDLYWITQEQINSNRR
jgi:hypothetical protein